ncbi:MAG: alpha/beta hydrolase [Proteobacteria bacterium]|nr:alpha/beta hydrolase [Pseudomonadota bacterium]
MPHTLPAPEWTSRFVSARDGLKLHVREIAARDHAKAPVLCLPGLTRSGRDFDVVGAFIAQQTGRRVLTLDSRGRGESEYDPDWKRYDLRVELEDLMEVLAALGVEGAVFLGTSRGGLLSMLMGTARPEVLRGVILNDIGPVIEARGLARIRGYVGKLPVPKDFEAATRLLRDVFGTQFTNLAPAQWEAWARRTWREEGDALVGRYDKNIMLTLAELDLEQPMPDLWPIFETIKHVPLMVIRGELSELLSQETAERMASEHPAGRLHVVPYEGHAPLLEDEATLAAISGFIGGLP